MTGHAVRVWVLATGLLLAGVLPAAADSPVGTWKIDAESYRAQMERMIEPMLQAVPQAQREQARAAMFDDAMMNDVTAARIEFKSDGSVTSTGTESEAEIEGTWTEQGDRVLIETRDGDDPVPRMIGTFEGASLVLRFDPSTQAGTEAASFMQGFEIHLLRE